MKISGKNMIILLGLILSSSKGCFNELKEKINCAIQELGPSKSTIGIVDVNGGKIAYEILEKKNEKLTKSNPVVLLHGMDGNRTCVRPVANELTKRGFRTINVDQLGHGQSTMHDPIAPDKLGVDRSAEDLHKALQNIPSMTDPNLKITQVAATNKKDRIILVAHSLGAAIAMKYVIDNPDLVAGLVLVTPIPLTQQDRTAALIRLNKQSRDNIQPALNLLPERIKTNSMIQSITNSNIAGLVGNIRSFATSEMLEYLTQLSYSNEQSAKVQEVFNNKEVARDLSQMIARLPKELPILIISGEKDFVYEGSRRYKTALEGFSNAAFKDIPEVGHLPFIENAPAFYAAVDPFLMNITAPSA